MRKVALIAGALSLATGLAWAAPAMATTTDPLAQAQAAAVEYFGVPCGGVVSVSYASLRSTTADTGGITLGTLWAYTQVGDEGDNPPASFTDCHIVISSDDWNTSSERANFPAFCGLIVHEYGHLFNHWDGDGWPTSSINYPIIGEANEHVAPCVARYSMFAPRPPAKPAHKPTHKPTHKRHRSHR